MNKLEITGIIYQINDTVEVGANRFRKREFIVTIPDERGNTQYDQVVKFECIKDGCDKLDAFQKGDEVDVAFNLKGNEHNGRFYVSLQAWKVTFAGADGTPPKQAKREQKPLADRNFTRPTPKTEPVSWDEGCEINF